jgi:DNA mismatch repair protein MutH
VFSTPTSPELDPEARVRRIEDLVAHARALIGTRVADIADGLGLPVPVSHSRSRGDGGQRNQGHQGNKGWSGHIIERELGGGEVARDTARPGDLAQGRGPDFGSLGVELKTVPVDRTLRPLESTAVCTIDPIAVAAESWQTSYIREKLARVLFVALEVPEGRSSFGDRLVVAAGLWSPSPAEAALLRGDFELIVRDYFRQGRADLLTGHVGKVLQVRPKARDARDVRQAFDENGRPTRVGKCGFYLRPAFVGAIVRGLRA